MLRRNSTIVNDWPGLHKAISPSLTIGFNAFGGSHEALLDYPGTERYFYFFKPLGREIPLNSRLPQLGLRGELPISTRTAVHYRVGASRQHLEPHEDSVIQDFQWRTRHLHANIEAVRQGLQYQTHIGGTLDRFSHEFDGPSPYKTYNLFKFFGMFSRSPSEAWDHSLMAMVVSNGKSAALKGAVAFRWGSQEKRSAGINLSYSQRLFEEENSYWYWVDQGSNFLESNGIEYTTRGDFSRNTQFTTDLILAFRLGRQLKVEASGFYRAFDGLYWTAQHFTLNPDDYSVSSPVVVHTGSGGQVLGLRCSIQWSEIKI